MPKLADALARKVARIAVLPVEGEPPFAVLHNKARPRRRRTARAADQLHDHLVDVVTGEVATDQVSNHIAESLEERLTWLDGAEFSHEVLEIRLEN
jgi:hypothetical protein